MTKSKGKVNKENEALVSQKALKELLEYNEIDGIFRNKVKRNSNNGLVGNSIEYDINDPISRERARTRFGHSEKDKESLGNAALFRVFNPVICRNDKQESMI